MKMWSGRFRQPLDPAFENWQRSFDFDRRLLVYEVAASGAHARALQKAGILDADELCTMLDGLEHIRLAAASNPHFVEDDECEDVHHFVEKRLVERIGDLGYKLHSGRSRNEQIATDLRLYVRGAIDGLDQQLGEWVSVIVVRAERAGTAAMPAYTHLQRAEPVLVAHWLLAYAQMFLRDLERLADCRKRVNRCPLGSGAVAGASLPLDRMGMAADLAFDGPTENSIDATGDRDFVIEFVNDLSLLAIHLSRWAEEMILFSTQEYGFIKIPEAYATGSSAMPQKKNPDLLELVRGKSAQIIGDGVALQTMLKGLPLAYNKDLQETQQPLFRSAESVAQILPMVTQWMRLVEFDYAALQDAAQSGFLNAWATATYLVRRGVPFRLAHEQIGKLVQLCVERGCELEDLPLHMLRELNPLFEQDIYECLQVRSVIAIHDVEGGTAPARVKEAIAAVREKLALIKRELHAHA